MNLAAVMNEFLYTPLMTLPQHTTIMTGAFFFPFSLITQESEGGSLRKQERHFFLSLDTVLRFQCRVVVHGGVFFSRETHGEALEEIPGSLL